MQERSLGSDVHRLGCLSYLQHRVHLAHIADLQDHAVLLRLLKAFRLDVDCVLPDLQRRRAVFSARVGTHLRDRVCGEMSQSHHCSGDHRVR